MDVSGQLHAQLLYARDRASSTQCMWAPELVLMPWRKDKLLAPASYTHSQLKQTSNINLIMKLIFTTFKV